MNNKFSDLNIKERIAIISACVAFALGWFLSICGFYVPPIGEVADSVLWILGQALIYAASVFGVASYFSAETVRMKADINHHIEEMERLKIERDNIRKNGDVNETPTIIDYSKP